MHGTGDVSADKPFCLTGTLNISGDSFYCYIYMVSDHALNPRRCKYAGYEQIRAYCLRGPTCDSNNGVWIFISITRVFPHWIGIPPVFSMSIDPEYG